MITEEKNGYFIEYKNYLRFCPKAMGDFIIRTFEEVDGYSIKYQEQKIFLSKIKGGHEIFYFFPMELSEFFKLINVSVQDWLFQSSDFSSFLEYLGISEEECHSSLISEG